MSKNEIRSGETVISSEPRINDTGKTLNRQEGKLPRIIIYDTLPFNNWGEVKEYIVGYRQARSDPGFREYKPSKLGRRVNAAIGVVSRSPYLRAGAAAVLALTGASLLPDNSQSEAASIQSIDTDLGYTPLFPHGEMVKYVHDDHEFGQIDNLNVREELPKLDSKQFVTYSGGGFTATRIHGDGAPTDLSYIIVGQGYNDQQLLDSAQLYAQNLLSIEPFSSVKDKISISVLSTQNTSDLGSTVTNPLGDSRVEKLIDNLNLQLAPFQETRIFLNDPGVKAAAFADPNQPTLYSRAAFTEGRLRFASIKGGVAHEEGHATGRLGEGYYSINTYHGVNVYINCITADQIPLKWRGILGAPGAIYEGCGNMATGAFRDAERDVMRNYSGVENPTYGPVALWQLNHTLNAAPAIYYSPTLLEPASGITTNRLGADLKFKPSIGTEQFQVQVIPFNYDGPGINLIIGDQKAVQAGTFNILEPRLGEGNYTMLPGMTYTWRIRGTSVKGPVGENDPVWGNWAERKFRTPDSSASTIKLPITLSEVNTNPTTPFRWVDTNRSIFYYEVQVSGDNRFDVDPETATSFVWWNLVHGGITKPTNSWTAPGLEANTTYFWRVRPRIQGDGKPADWGSTWVVKVGPDGHSYRVSQVELDANGKQSLVTAYEYNAPKTQATTESQTDNQVNIKLEANDCIRDFFPQRPLDLSDILDPSCYRLMGDPITLQPGDIKIGGLDKTAYLPNRERKRKEAREARKNTHRAA